MSIKWYIVTRHKATVEYLLKYVLKIDESKVSILEHLTEKEARKIKNSILYGVFPLRIIDILLKGNNVVYQVMVDIPKELRGKDLGLKDLLKCGVRIYRVDELEMTLVYRHVVIA